MFFRYLYTTTNIDDKSEKKFLPHIYRASSKCSSASPCVMTKSSLRGSRRGGWETPGKNLFAERAESTREKTNNVTNQYAGLGSLARSLAVESGKIALGVEISPLLPAEEKERQTHTHNGAILFLNFSCIERAQRRSSLPTLRSYPCFPRKTKKGSSERWRLAFPLRK